MRQFVKIARAILTEGRWRRSLTLAVLFAVLCAGLSWWQFARRTETATANAQIAANWNANPRPVADVLPTLTAFPASTQWLPVELHGRYLVDQQLLARDRPLNGRPGFEVLTPLLLDNGDVFVVDRGWVSIGDRQDRPDSVPAPPTGTVTVTARLQAGEQALLGRAAPPSGEISDINLPTVASVVNRPTYTGAYGLLRSESPAVATVPVGATEPSLDEGTHLSYAIQWIVFALIGFAGLGWSVRQDLRDAGDPDVAEADERAALRRMRRAPSDAEVEDALIDS